MSESVFGEGNAVIEIVDRSQPSGTNPVTGNPEFASISTLYKAKVTAISSGGYKVTASSSSGTPAPGDHIPQESIPIQGRLTDPLQWKTSINRLPQEIDATVDGIAGKLYLTVTLRSYWGVDDILGAKFSGYFYPI